MPLLPVIATTVREAQIHTVVVKEKGEKKEGKSRRKRREERRGEKKRKSWSNEVQKKDTIVNTGKDSRSRRRETQNTLGAGGSIFYESISQFFQV